MSPYDCTGCQLCVGACPDGALVSQPIDQVLLAEDANWQFAKALPERTDVLDHATVKGSQFVTPLLEVRGPGTSCDVIYVSAPVPVLSTAPRRLVSCPHYCCPVSVLFSGAVSPSPFLPLLPLFCCISCPERCSEMAELLS